MVKGKRALGVVVATAAIAATMAVAGCSASDANQGGGETASIKKLLPLSRCPRRRLSI